MVHSSTDSNDMLSALELTDFIDDLELFAGPERLGGECASSDSTSLSAAASKTRHGNASSSTYLMPMLPDAELTTTMSLLVEEPRMHLLLGDDDDSFLGPIWEELGNVHTEGGVSDSTTPVALQHSAVPSSVALTTGAFGDGAMDSAEQTFLPKKKKTSSQRQREEIAYLLGKVRELEGALRTIAHEMAEAASSESTVAALPDSSVPVDSLWEATAKHQLEQKKRAEIENVKLREKLAGEIGFAKSLGRMLRKRKIWDGLQEKRKQPRFVELHPKQDSDIFDTLMRHVDERVRTLGVVPDAKGFTDGNSSSSSSPNICTNGEGGMCIDLSTMATVPFDFQKIADIVWTHLRPLCARLACDKTTIHMLNQTEDFLFRKEARPLQIAGDTHQTTIHAACKRVVQENRVVMLWEQLTEARGPSGAQCIQIRSKGCGEILRGEATINGSPSSLLRSTLSVIPHMVQDTNTSIAFNDDGTAPKVPKRKSEMVGLLSELLIASHQQHSQMSQQFIENALFDDLIQGK